MHNKKLSLALKANAAFSVFSGLAMIFFHSQLAVWMGIKQPQILLVIGIILLGFAFLVYKTATATIISKKRVQFIIVQDWLWVCLLYTSPSPRDQRGSRMPSSA